MQLNEFMEKFSPEYNGATFSEATKDEVVEKHFSVALRNFTNKLCEAQRFRCQITFNAHYVKSKKGLASLEDLYQNSGIHFNTIQPSIRELL